MAAKPQYFDLDHGAHRLLAQHFRAFRHGRDGKLPWVRYDKEIEEIALHPRKAADNMYTVKLKGQNEHISFYAYKTYIYRQEQRKAAKEAKAAAKETKAASKEQSKAAAVEAVAAIKAAALEEAHAKQTRKASRARRQPVRKAAGAAGPPAAGAAQEPATAGRKAAFRPGGRAAQPTATPVSKSAVMSPTPVSRIARMAAAGIVQEQPKPHPKPEVRFAPPRVSRAPVLHADKVVLWSDGRPMEINRWLFEAAMKALAEVSDSDGDWGYMFDSDEEDCRAEEDWGDVYTAASGVAGSPPAHYMQAAHVAPADQDVLYNHNAADTATTADATFPSESMRSSVADAGDVLDTAAGAKPTASPKQDRKAMLAAHKAAITAITATTAEAAGAAAAAALKAAPSSQLINHHADTGCWVRKQPLQPGSPYNWPGFPPLVLDKPISLSKSACDQTATEDTGKTGDINNGGRQGILSDRDNDGEVSSPFKATASMDKTNMQRAAAAAGVDALVHVQLTQPSRQTLKYAPPALWVPKATPQVPVGDLISPTSDTLPIAKPSWGDIVGYAGGGAGGVQDKDQAPFCSHGRRW